MDSQKMPSVVMPSDSHVISRGLLSEILMLLRLLEQTNYVTAVVADIELILGDRNETVTDS